MLVVWPSNDRVHASRFIPCVPTCEGTHPSPILASAFRVGVLRVLHCVAPHEDHLFPLARLARCFPVASIARRRCCRYCLRPLAATFLLLGLMLP